MKHFSRKILSLLLTLALMSFCTLPAAASDVLCVVLTAKGTPLHSHPQLSTTLF